jgi:hypothetical protein
MRRTTIGLIAFGLAVVGGLISPAEAGAVGHCNVDVELASGQPAIDCKGSPSGPWRWPTPGELVPEPDVDVDLNT